MDDRAKEIADIIIQRNLRRFPDQLRDIIKAYGDERAKGHDADIHKAVRLLDQFHPDVKVRMARDILILLIADGKTD